MMAAGVGLALLLTTQDTVRADDGYTDITGRTLAMHVRFPTKETGQMLEVPVPAGLLSAQAQQLLNTPLSQMFDSLWSGAKDANGKTLRDRSCDSIQSLITKKVHSGSYSAYDIDCSLASTGPLRAKVAGTSLILSYLLPNDSVIFRSTSPYTCANGTFLCPTDPRFKLSFDAELEIVTPIPDLPCMMTPKARALAYHARIDADNGSADILDAIKTALNFFTDQPTAIFQAAEGQVDSAQQAVDVSPLTTLLDQLQQGCIQAAGLGFHQFEALADPDDGLLFRLDHALDVAPNATDEIAYDNGLPSFFKPIIGTNQSEVKAGGQLGVTGSYFNGAETTHLRISWNDTISGALTESDIQWGPQGGQMAQVVKQRGNYDNGNFFDSANLLPGTAYQFQLRDCDQITCTPWSNLLKVTTGAQGTDQVLFYLDSVAQANQIGSGTVGSDGAFSATVTIPAATVAGPHTLFAVVPGTGQKASEMTQLNAVASGALSGISGGATPPSQGSRGSAASIGPVSLGAQGQQGSAASIGPVSLEAVGQQAVTSITVVAAGQSLQPVITVIDATTSAPIQSLVEGERFTLRGVGFAAGQVTVTLDKTDGQTVGTLTAAGDGTFKAQLTMPSGTGSRTLIATQVANGQTLQATWTVFVQMLPR